MTAILFICACSSVDINKELTNGIRQYEADGLKQAIVTLTKVISATDTCSKCFLYRGFAFKALNDYDNALKDFNLLINLDTREGVGYANRASIYYIKKDYNNALKDFTKALELDSSSKVLYNPICHMLFVTGQKDKACIYYNKALEVGDTTFDKSIIDYCEKKKYR